MSSNRDVHLDISATDRASGPLGRIDRQAQKLQETMEAFDGKRVASSFSAIARAAAIGGRAVEREMDVLAEAIEKGERNLAAAAKAAERHAKDVAKSQADLEKARSTAGLRGKEAADSAARVKALEIERIKALKASSKRIADETVKLAREEREKIEAAMAPRASELAGLKGKRGTVAADRRKEISEEIRLMKAQAANLGRLEATISAGGMTGRTRARASELLGGDRIAALQQSATAELDRKIAEANAASRAAADEARAFEASAAKHRKALDDAEKSAAKSRKFIEAEQNRLAGLRETRAKAEQMRQEYQGTTQRVFVAREAFEKSRDPREAARAVDGIAGANGEVLRTADGQKRLAGAADTATSAMKRQKAAFDANRGALADLRHSLAGLLSLYMIIQTAVDQASKAIDAFRSKQSFESRINYTNDADFQDTANQLQYVRDLAQKYGLEIQDLQSRYSSFATAADALGLSTEKVQTVFNGLSAAARVNKMSTDEYGRAITSLTQMIGKNQVMSEELKGQLAEAFPPAVGLFSKAMGYAEHETAKFLKALEDGRFKGEDVIKFAALLEVEFGGAAERAGESFDAMLNRFRNSMTYAREEFAKAGLIDGLTDFMGRAEDFFASDEGKEFFVKAGESAKAFLSLLGYVVENIEIITKIVGGLFLAKGLKMAAGVIASVSKVVYGFGRVAVAVGRNIGSLTNVVSALRVAFASLSGPIGAAITALAFAAPWIYDLISSSSAKKVETAKKLDQINDALGGVSQAAKDANGNVDKLRQSLGRLEISDALDESKVLLGAADRDLISVSDAIIARRNAGQEMETPSGRVIRKRMQDFRSGSLPFQSANGGESLDKHITEWRKFGVINDEEAAALRKYARAAEEAAGRVKDLGKAKSALTDDDAAKGLLGDEAEKAASDNLKKINALTAGIEALDEKAGSDKGMAKAKSGFEAIRQESVKLQTELDRLKGAMSPEDYASKASRIAAAFKTSFQEVTKSIFDAQAAAMGFEVKLGDMGADAVSGLTTLGNTMSPAQASTKLERANYIRSGLIKRGMPNHVADAFLANFQDESGLNPGITEGKPNVHGTRGYGLYQLTDTKAGVGRRTQFEAYAKGRGKSFDDIDTQLDFLIEELRTTERAAGDKIMGSKTTAEAAQAIVSRFLRPAKAHERSRVAKYAGLKDTSSSASVDSSTIGLGDSGIDPNVKFGGFASAEAQRRAISAAAIADSVSGGYGDVARDALQSTFIKNPDMSMNEDLLLAIREKRTDDIISMIGAVDSKAAHAFRRASQGTATLEAASKAMDDADKLAKGTREANAEISEAQRAAMLAGLDDERKRFEIETKAAIDKQVSDGEISRSTGNASLNAKLAEFDAKQAAERAKLLKDNATSAQGRIDAARAPNDLARARVEAEAEAQRQKLTGLEREKFIRDRMNADQIVAEKSAKDAQDAALQAARDANELAGTKNELRKIELQELQKIAAEDKASGLTTSDADKAARVKAAQDVYKASNPGWRSEQILIDNDVSALQAQKEALNAQLQSAMTLGDTGRAEALKAEIRGINDEMLKLIDTAIRAHEAIGGPEAIKAVAGLQQQREAITSSRDAVSGYGQAAEYWGVKSGEALSGGISAFAKAIAESENPWRALVSTVASSVGQIMIDIGAMIVKAVIAKQVMAMLGLDANGAATPGSPAAGGGFFSKLLLGGFQAITGTGSFALPVQHTGGVSGESGGTRRRIGLDGLANLAADERLSITRVGEEVLTEDDPRHISNVGNAVAGLQRTHAAGRVNPSRMAGSVSSGGPSGRFASPIQDAAETMAAAAVGGAGRSEQPVINNLFDVDDFVNRGLSTASGQRAIMNVVTQNPKKFRAALGLP